MKTQIVEWGWCGFGYIPAGQKGNLFSAICLGVVRIQCSRQRLVEAMKDSLK